MTEKQAPYTAQGGGIIRVKKDARYFAASNEPFNDVRLSWEARGLMGYLLSKPDTWQVQVTDLENKGPAKEHKLRRMLAELRKAGYMNRIRLTIPGGKFNWMTEVYESPSLNPKPTSWGFSTSGLSTSGKPPDIVSTDLHEEEEEDGAVQNVFTLYTQEIGLLTPIIADGIEAWLKDVPEKWLRDAITEAVKNGARNWKYIEAILKRWHAQGNQEPVRKPARTANSKKPAAPQWEPVVVSAERQEELRKLAAERLGGVR